jgi:hypothetical protein
VFGRGDGIVRLGEEDAAIFNELDGDVAAAPVTEDSALVSSDEDEGSGIVFERLENIIFSYSRGRWLNK